MKYKCKICGFVIEELYLKEGSVQKMFAHEKTHKHVKVPEKEVVLKDTI